MRLARAFLYAAGIAGIGTIAAVFLVEDRSFTRTALDAVCWGAVAFCDAQSRRYLYPYLYGIAAPRNKTWDEAAVFSLIAVVLVDSFFCKSVDEFSSTVSAMGLALNISYAALKGRCWIMRCCEFKRTTGIYAILGSRGISSQPVEMVLSLATFLAGALLLKNPVASALISYLGHATIRYFDQLGRFSKMPWVALLRWRILVFAGFAVLPMLLAALP